MQLSVYHTPLPTPPPFEERRGEAARRSHAIDERLIWSRELQQIFTEGAFLVSIYPPVNIESKTNDNCPKYPDDPRGGYIFHE